MVRNILWGLRELLLLDLLEFELELDWPQLEILVSDRVGAVVMAEVRDVLLFLDVTWSIVLHRVEVILLLGLVIIILVAVLRPTLAPIPSTLTSGLILSQRSLVLGGVVV